MGHGVRAAVEAQSSTYEWLEEQGFDHPPRVRSDSVVRSMNGLLRYTVVAWALLLSGALGAGPIAHATPSFPLSVSNFSSALNDT